MSAITPALLDEAEYRRYDRDPTNRAEHFVALWEKRVDDEAGTRYVIHITEYDLGRYTGVDGARMFQSNVQFTFGEAKVNMSYLPVSEETIDDIETFYWTAFNRMEFDHYSPNETAGINP